MEITVRSKNGSLPRSLETFAIEKLEHLGRFLSTINVIQVEFDQEGRHHADPTHVVRVTVSTPGPVFRSRVTSSDPRAALDAAASRLERRLKEFKRMRSGKPAHSRPKGISADMLGVDENPAED
ncbi:MAG TPA: ribosome-associated translation inhibitor RaiA [Actinomycetota bacterium]|nr:ribosome-associated translation inhibitor RaiA [Actinomycetota bacterium]